MDGSYLKMYVKICAYMNAISLIIAYKDREIMNSPSLAGFIPYKCVSSIKFTPCEIYICFIHIIMNLPPSFSVVING